MNESLAILIGFFSNTGGIFSAALLAFFFNRKLNKATKEQEDLDNFYSITMDISRIHNDLICMYKSFALTKQKEIDLHEAIKNIHQMLKGKISDEDLDKTIHSLRICHKTPRFDSIYTIIQGGRLEFFTDIKKLSFMNGYNPLVMNAVLILGQSLSELNQVIEELNKYLDRNIDKRGHQNEAMIFDTTKSFISKLNFTLAFANVASDLLFKWGKTVFEDKFKITVEIDHNNSKFNGTLPVGYEYLTSSPPKSKIWTRVKKSLHDLLW